MNNLSNVLLVLGLGLALSRAQETYLLDTNRSAIQVHVGTAGLLGSVGHAHLIQTPIERGTFVYYPADPGRSSVELRVDAGGLQVTDAKLSAKDRKEIQAKMQSERVLNSQQYPKIVFRSSAIESLDRTHLRVTGNLSLRDKTQSVTLRVSLDQVGPQFKATGECQFKQTTFGIRPVAAGLGTVRVKDEVDISFVIFGEPKSSQGP
jgi:polyisoprenoid-binding protein YceI